MPTQISSDCDKFVCFDQSYKCNEYYTMELADGSHTGAVKGIGNTSSKEGQNT